PEYHLDTTVIDFDPAYDGANDILHAEPVEIIEPGCHLGREVFQTADHEGKVAFGLSCVESCLVPLLQLGHALFQACDARLELSFVDDAFGITVDKPSNPAPQTRHLLIEANDLVRRGRVVTGLVNATAIFIG